MVQVTPTNGCQGHILFVHHAGLGGATVSLSQILRRLKQEHFKTTVLLLCADARAIELLEEAGSRVLVNDRLAQFQQVIGGWNFTVPFGLYYTLRSLVTLGYSLRKFRALLAELDPDLIYLNTLPTCLYALPAQRAHVPVILHVREIVEAGPFGAWRRIYQRVIEGWVTKTVYIGDYERVRLAAGGPSQVIANYVDLSVWRRNHGLASAPDAGSIRKPVGAEGIEGRFTHRALAGPAGTPVPPSILFVGGLNPIKGIDVLLPALALLRERGVPFRWVCLGVETGRRRPKGLKRVLYAVARAQSYREIRAFVDGAGLAKQSEFKPYTNHPVDEYAAADIVVFPSTRPHFPRPLVEAGALGLPVVASDLPGPQAVVQPGVNGVLVPANDPTALADALQQLLENPELRARMGRANYEVVKERFNATVNETEIVALISCCACRDGAEGGEAESPHLARRP